MSLVESILENPNVVLWAQVDRLKTEKLAELKADGVEYDERMEELDKITWPKPLADFIYDTFNAFAAKHPWVAQENIRPKSVAREMFERFCSFHDYVRDYELQRSEGVLVALPVAGVQGARADGAARRCAPTRSTTCSRRCARCCARSTPACSTSGRACAPTERRQRRRRRRSPSRSSRAWCSGRSRDDPRALAARVRGELHRLIAALAGKRYEEAAELVRAPDDGAPWTAATLAEAMAPYWAEHASIDVTPRARAPRQTLIAPAEARGTFTARQRLLDPAGDEDWMLDCFVDVRGEVGDGPLVELRAIRR